MPIEPHANTFSACWCIGFCSVGEGGAQIDREFLSHHFEQIQTRRARRWLEKRPHLAEKMLHFHPRVHNHRRRTTLRQQNLLGFLLKIGPVDAGLIGGSFVFAAGLLDWHWSKINVRPGIRLVAEINLVFFVNRREQTGKCADSFRCAQHEIAAGP